MKWVSFLAATAVLLAPTVRGAADEVARAAVTQAFVRQKALPGYVEHQYGQLPIMPSAPEIGEDSAAPSSEQSDAEPVIELSPEQEIATIEHAGNREHQLFANGVGEIVRGDGRMAYKFTAPAQVTARLSAVTAESTDDLAQEIQTTVKTIKALSAALARAGSIEVVGAAMSALDQVALLVSHARSTADLMKASAMLQRLSGTWQCKPDPSPQYPSKLLSVEPLEDRSIGRVRAHVYSAIWGFDSAQGGYQLQGRVWIGVSDGVPLRSELSFPNGTSLRTEYEYPTVAPDISLPQCAAPRS
jgi:hypothetical protein